MPFPLPRTMIPLQSGRSGSSAAPPVSDSIASAARAFLLPEGHRLGLQLIAAGQQVCGQLQEGARRMTSLPIPRSTRLAVVPGLRHLAVGGLQVAWKGCALAALIEMPVALLEEGMAVRRGEKTTPVAALAAGGKMAAAALAGGAGAGLAFGLGSLGLGGLLVPVAPALLVAGGASVAISSGIRLRSALAAPAPALRKPLAPPAAVLDLSRGQVVCHEDVWFALPAG